MSTIERRPILHGRDHCPDGADPIPCMISGPSGSYEDIVVGISDLYAYWRLGETGEPWADTSGVGVAADLSEEETGTALTPDVTGALPAPADDGALEFNYDGIVESGGRYARNSGGSKEFDMSPNGEMTVAVWAKVKASALTRRGLIIGNSNISPSGGNHMVGWGLQVVYPARSVRFSRGQPGGFGQPELHATTASGLIADTWYLIVGTFDGATIKLYLNAVLVDSTADTSDAVPEIDIMLGAGATELATTSDHDAYFYGTADEAAIWTRALTQAEIDSLYTAGVEGGAAGSLVLLSDGAGGTYWGQVTTAAIEDGTIVDADVATGADIDPLKIEHPGGTTTFLRADGTWAAAGGGDPADDTLVWMPLADSDGILVLDADDAVIPTLIPI